MSVPCSSGAASTSPVRLLCLWPARDCAVSLGCRRLGLHAVSDLSARRLEPATSKRERLAACSVGPLGVV